MNKNFFFLIWHMLSFFVEGVFAQTLPPVYTPPPTEWDYEHPSIVSGFELDDNWAYTPIQASDGSIVVVGFSDRYNNGSTGERHPAILKYIPGPVRKIQWETIPTFPAGAVPNITIADSGSGGFNDVFESNESGTRFLYACGIIRKVISGGVSERIPVIAKFYLSTGYLVWFKEVGGFTGARFTRMAPVYNSSGVLTSIYIAGESSVGGGTIKATIFKLRPDGTLDPTFDGDGWRQYSASGLLSSLPTSFRDLAFAPDVSGLGDGFIAVGNVLKSGGPMGDGSWTQPDRDVFVVRLRADNGDMPFGNAWPRIFSEDLLGPLYIDIDSPEPPVCVGIDPEVTNNEEGFSVRRMPDGNFVILCRFDFIELPGNAPNVCSPFDTEQYYDNDMVLIKIRFDNGAALYTIDAGRSIAIDGWNVLATASGCNELYLCGSNFVGGYILPTVIRVDDQTGSFVFRWRKDVMPKHEYACIFGICLTSDGGVVVCGNNGENGDDYVFIKVSNDRQLNTFYDQMSTDISFPVTWDTPRRVMGTIRIKSGGVLTIENTTIQFANTYVTNDWHDLAQGGGTPTKIVVEPKGQLILRNCILKGMATGLCSVGDQEWMWEGIVLLGRPDLLPIPAYQGSVYMDQDSRIENAYIGVSVGSTWYNSDGRANETLQDGGGILRSHQPLGTVQAHFLNCRRSIIYAPVTHPVTPSYSFTNTNFLCDRPMLDVNFVDPEGGGRLGISYFVGVRNRDRLIFDKCSFKSTGNYPEKARGVGFDNFDSQVSLRGCRFERLYTGVSAQYAVGVTDPTAISGCTFSQVRHGGHIVGGSFHYCAHNTFEDIPDNLFNDASYGLRFEGSTNVTVSDSNRFASSGAGTYGVIIKDSYFYSSEIGRNAFEHVDFGVQTEQSNTGLQIRCNSYTGTERAWSINPATPANTPGLFSDQGLCGQSNYQAGNLFNDPDCPVPGMPESHIRSKVDFKYHARSGSPYDPNEIPTCVSDGPAGSAGIVDVVLCGLSSNPAACSFPCYECEYAQAMLEEAESQADDWTKYYLYGQAVYLYLKEGDIEGALEVIGTHFKADPTLYIGSLINTGDFEAARAAIDALDFSDISAADVGMFYQVMIDLAEAGKYFTDMDEAQEAIIASVAVGTAPVKYSAQNILSHAKGYVFERPVEVWLDELRYVEERGEEGQSLSDRGLMVRPNPSYGFVEVRWDAEDGTGMLDVFRSDGAIILSQRLDLSSGSTHLSFDNEPVGAYLIRLTSSKGTQVQKLVLK